MINREDMLELTRRMTVARTHLTRVAGAYVDAEGYIDGTFNTHFRNLKGEERERTLKIAKAIPFSRTNEELVDYLIPGMRPGSIWQLFYALCDCGLENDALLLTFYEWLAGQLGIGAPYAIYVYHGAYDVPVKAADKYRLDESEEVYRYLIVTVCPMAGEQIPAMPESGFLYPAFRDRSADWRYINVFKRGGLCPRNGDLAHILGLRPAK